MKTVAYDADFIEQPSRFAVPLDLLGGGCFRWPETPSLDAKTLRRVVRSEIGGKLVHPEKEITTT